MKASEVLKQYRGGRRDFRGENLRGQSFRGANLSGADLSEADIRGTNFRSANLTGANFTAAKAGLLKRWAIVLVIASLLVSVLSGCLAALGGYFVALIFDSSNLDNQVAGWISLIVLLVFYIVSIRQGIVAAFRTVAFAGAVALAGAIAGAGTIAGVEAVALAGAFTGAVAGAGTLAGAVTFTVTFTVAFAFAFTGAVATVLLSAYLSWRALKDDPRDAWIRSITIAFAAIGGTSFRGANLTDADFTRATLKSTDFREATVIRTCWSHAQKLDRIRPGTTYLSHAKIRELVRTGQGQDKNFDRLDLRGVNLQGASLVHASFIGSDLGEANLQDADLSRAKLVQTQLDRVDFTGATLTGAFLEEWGITADTILKGIRCDYVFMRLPPDKRPDFLELPPTERTDEDPHRKPDDWKAIFAEGEFVDFISPLIQTLDLYHNQADDPRAIAYAFNDLKEKHPEAHLEIIAMEKRGRNREGLLIRAETNPQADRSQLHSEYFQTHNYLKTLPPSEFQQLLDEKERQIKRLEGWVDMAMNRPGIYAQNYHNQGDTTMSDQSSGFSISHASDIQVVQGDNNKTTKGDNSITNQGDNNQAIQGDNNQVGATATDAEALTPQKVVELLAYLEDRIQNLEALPPATKEKSVKRLAAAKVEAEESEPDKESIGKSLKRVNADLEEASKTAKGIKEFVEEVAPTFVKIGKWLGMVVFG